MGKRREIQEFLQEHPDYIPEGWSDRSPPPPTDDKINVQPVPPRMFGRSSVLICVAAVLVSFYMGRLASESSWSGAAVSPVIVMKRMRLDRYDPQVQMEGCEALSQLDSARLNALGTLGLLLQVMQDHPDAAELQECCCRTLEMLTRGGDKYATSYPASLATSTLLFTMRRHRYVDNIQRNGLMVLTNIAQYVDKQVEVSGLGDIELVLDAFRAHPGREALNRQLNLTLELRALSGGQSFLSVPWNWTKKWAYTPGVVLVLLAGSLVWLLAGW